MYVYMYIAFSHEAPKHCNVHVIHTVYISEYISRCICIHVYLKFLKCAGWKVLCKSPRKFSIEILYQISVQKFG